jgi:acetolactate synthase-1/2/3 large subunit
VMDVEDLAYTVREAFHVARTGRPGPVLIDLPKDVQVAKTDFVYPEDEIVLPGYRPAQPATEEQLLAARELIEQAERPVILAGHGITMSGAAREVLEFAELTQTPFAMTLLCKGCLPDNHPLSLGMMGMHGTCQANLAIQNADLLLAFGMRFDDRVTGNLKTYAPEAKKIHIDIDPSEMHKIVQVDLPVVADLKTVLNQLLPMLEPQQHQAWLGQVRDWIEDTDERDIVNQDTGDRLFAAQVIHDLWKVTGGEATIVTDVGQHQMLVAQYYSHCCPQDLITSGGLGTMGFGLPAALGAAVGLGTTNVWAVVGDGGFQMTQAELATAVQERVPFNIAIMNNGFLGMVRQWQELFFEERYNATPISGPDFVMLAQAHGIPARRVTRREEVIPAIEWANSVTDGPVLLDFVVEQLDIVYPMVPAGASLHEMIRRPIPEKKSV